MESNNNIKLTIVIPVRNEGLNIRMMLKFLRASVEIDHELLIVYDDDKDDTLAILEEMSGFYSSMRPVKNTYGRGVPNALRYGIDQAQGEYVLILTADDLGPILSIDRMVELMNQGYDLVNTTRYAQGGRYLGGYFISRILSWLANKIYKWISNTPLTDFTLGIKMFRRSMAKELDLKAKVGWSIAFEMAIKSQLMGYRTTEIPIISINRFYGGKSSFAVWPWVVEYSQWFVWGVGQQFKKGQLRIQSMFHQHKPAVAEK